MTNVASDIAYPGEVPVYDGREEGGGTPGGSKVFLERAVYRNTAVTPVGERKYEERIDDVAGI